MATEWAWGKDAKAVALTEQDIRTVIERIVEAITVNSQSTLLEQYKQFVRVEGELTRSREREAALQSEVASLRTHISHLNSFLTTLAPVNGSSFPPPYPSAPAPTAHFQVPTYPDRVAASAPIPLLNSTPTE